MAGATLGIDHQTLVDLDIFGTDPERPSVFQFCNLSRSDGGTRVLKQRMAAPWATVARIRETQAAITFIQEERPAFDVLPSSYSCGRVDHYQHEILPVIAKTGNVEFTLDALSLWLNHERHYHSITSGVQMTCAFIRHLRRFAGQACLEQATGELRPLVEELAGLLTGTRITEVPEDEVGGWMLRILRLDQVFRIDEAETINRLLMLVYEIDALVAMADATSQHGLIMPFVEEGSLQVQAENVYHPFVPDAVANPVSIDQQRRVLFLTGPNMAGKTTYLRAFATAIYLAHLGMGVPATSFRFAPASRLFSSISLSDDLSQGVSYFRAEALRVKAIAEAVSAGHRVIAIMDEPFKGTNVKDAMDASLAVLERFAVREDCLFMFSSHLIELSEAIDVREQIDCRYFDADESEARLRFDYRMREGTSAQRLGMRVLEEEGIFRMLDGDN